MNTDDKVIDVLKEVFPLIDSDILRRCVETKEGFVAVVPRKDGAVAVKVIYAGDSVNVSVTMGNKIYMATIRRSSFEEMIFVVLAIKKFISVI